MLLVFAAPIAKEAAAFTRLYRNLPVFPGDDASRLGGAQALQEALVFALTWGPLHDERQLEQAEIFASWPCAIFTFRELQEQDGYLQLVKVRYGFADSSSALLHGYHTTPGRRSLVLPESHIGHFAQRMLVKEDKARVTSRSGWVGRHHGPNGSDSYRQRRAAWQKGDREGVCMARRRGLRANRSRIETHRMTCRFQQ